MEKRAILTIVICAVIFFLWIEFVHPRLFPAPPAPQKTETAASENTPAPPPQPKSEPKVEPKPEPAKNYPEEEHHVSAGKYSLTFTNRGAGIRELKLKYPNESSEVALLTPMEPDRPQFALRIPNLPGSLDLAAVTWNRIGDPNPLKVVYEYNLPNKVTATKSYVIDDKRYVIEFQLDFRKNDELDKSARFAFEIMPFSGIVPDSDYKPEDYCTAFIGNRSGDSRSVDTKPVAKIDKEEWRVEDKKKEWAGIKNHYFAAVFIPDEESLKVVEAFRFRPLSPEGKSTAGEARNLDLFVTCAEIEVGKQPVLLGYSVYIGPLHADSLKEVPRGLEELIGYGWFDFVARIILAVLNFFFGICKNYGVAILLTTICIRICIFPLSRKSQVSMFKIQQLQPKIAILRERYKDDQQKLGLEQMRLFRENKVSPLSGCLPLLLQLPIFIAMFNVLNLSIDLRRSPFFGWIHDLSQPDQLLGPWKPVTFLFFTVGSLNLLPIIMTITWFLQGYFAPRSTDPQMAAQQKMMMFMPIVFGLLCYNYAAGLSFYFFVNSLLAMAEQKIIKKVWLSKLQEQANAGGT